MVRELLLVARHGPPPPAPATATERKSESTNPNDTGRQSRYYKSFQESSAVASARRVTRGRHADARTRAKCHASPEGGGGSPRPRRGRRRFAGAGPCIGAGAAASDAGPRPPAQRPPPVPRDAIVRSSMGSLVDRACSGYTKTKKLNEAGERSAPVRVGELPGASPRGAGSPGRSARRVGLGF